MSYIFILFTHQQTRVEYRFGTTYVKRLNPLKLIYPVKVSLGKKLQTRLTPELKNVTKDQGAPPSLLPPTV